MNPLTLFPIDEPAKQLLDAQAHIWNHIFDFQISMALKCAIELGIPDAVQNHGKPISLSELATKLNLHPSKASSLNRLMRLLVHTNFFSMETLPNGEFTFNLTINSKLLLENYPLSQAPFARAMLDQTLIEPAYHISSWFKTDSESPFQIAHGKSIWEHAGCMAKFNEYFNQAMASDARFVASLLCTSDESRGIFEGIESLVDVAGGDGTLAKAIAMAYPGLKCTVLELPHVVEGLQNNGLNVVYVGGDMFEAIPPAQVALLKWIMHDWSDEHCIKILRKCKEAIPSKNEGGKVIIIDIVIMDDQNDKIHKYSNTQSLLDMAVMSLTIGGKERTEQQWKQLLLDADFSGGYKVFPVLGLRSIIEVYP